MKYLYLFDLGIKMKYLEMACDNVVKYNKTLPFKGKGYVETELVSCLKMIKEIGIDDFTAHEMKEFLKDIQIKYTDNTPITTDVILKLQQKLHQWMERLDTYLVLQGKYYIESIKKLEKAPIDIINDMKEAILNYNVGSFKSCVTMCRRAIQQTVEAKNATGNDLFQKINNLKMQGLMDEADYHAFSTCRKFGNYGAHPNNDDLKDVDVDAAKLALDVSIRVIARTFS